MIDDIFYFCKINKIHKKKQVMSSSQMETYEQDDTLEHFFVIYFMKSLKQMFAQLKVSFYDCSNTSLIMGAFEKYIFDNDQEEQIKVERQTKFVENWHKIFESSYQLIAQDPVHNFENCLSAVMDNAAKHNFENIETILESEDEYKGSSFTKKMVSLLTFPLYVLKQLKIDEKFADPTFDSESKKYLICYFLHLNGFSIFHNSIPKSIIHSTKATTADFLRNSDPEVLKSQNPTVILNSPAFQNTFEQFSDSNGALLMEIMQNVPQVMLGMSCLSGVGLEGGDMLEQVIHANSEQFNQLGEFKSYILMLLPILRNYKPENGEKIAKFMKNMSSSSPATTGSRPSGFRGQQNDFSGFLGMMKMMNPLSFTSLLQNYSSAMASPPE